MIENDKRMSNDNPTILIDVYNASNEIVNFSWRMHGVYDSCVHSRGVCWKVDVLTYCTNRSSQVHHH